ncbi:uncharacterized protein LOC131255550 isoform X4 [Magnolia sinica]|uniref:uncharacterized protein LOC131255550 isoform X4 n=1 Tax=Magnolia sinica TaxID=86752 RepID=UPI00265B5D48|nr:uncharacterized protein LOC131255550 isoform X4 [Magnolia sinica]XP_058112274.1 uncharacterized protein LOC131255550 isoform X4 [Magnolia sinica]
MVFTMFCNFSFQDRRYEYKGLNKVWKGKLAEAKASGDFIRIHEARISPLLVHLLLLIPLTVLLSPPIVIYSPRVLLVYCYDAHADCAKNVRSSGVHGTNNYILTEF